MVEHKGEPGATCYVRVARERVVRFIWRTGRETFSYQDVGVKPATLKRLADHGFIVRSRSEKHKRSYCNVYRLAGREKWRIEQFKSRAGGVII